MRGKMFGAVDMLISSADVVIDCSINVIYYFINVCAVSVYDHRDLVEHRYAAVMVVDDRQ